MPAALLIWTPICLCGSPLDSPSARFERTRAPASSSKSRFDKATIPTCVGTVSPLTTAPTCAPTASLHHRSSGQRSALKLVFGCRANSRSAWLSSGRCKSPIAMRASVAFFTRPRGPLEAGLLHTARLCRPTPGMSQCCELNMEDSTLPNSERPCHTARRGDSRHNSHASTASISKLSTNGNACRIETPRTCTSKASLFPHAIHSAMRPPICYDLHILRDLTQTGTKSNALICTFPTAAATLTTDDLVGRNRGQGWASHGLAAGGSNAGSIRAGFAQAWNRSHEARLQVCWRNLHFFNRLVMGLCEVAGFGK